MADLPPLAGEHPHPSPASSAATALGPLLLLPSELLHEILLRLAVPELLRVRSVARPLSSLISSSDFRRLYHLSSASSGGGGPAAIRGFRRALTPASVLSEPTRPDSRDSPFDFPNRRRDPPDSPLDLR